MSTAQSQDLTLAEKVHQGYIQTIVHNLNQAGHYATLHDITPVTHETSFPVTKELKSIGAHVIGSEDLQSFHNINFKNSEYSDNPKPLDNLVIRFLKKLNILK